MKIPKKLKIGGHNIKVVLKPFWKGSDSEDGLFENCKNEIWIKAELSQSQKEVTLIHEILHVLNSTLNHVVLDSLSEQLYRVLKDNKSLRP